MISNRHAFSCDPGRIIHVKITGLCSVSDCFGFLRPPNCNGQTSYLRLKTSVKLHIDQMMRIRNFRVRNKVVERRAVTKSQKGKKAYVERNVEECFQWKAHGQCSEGDSCSFSHELASGNRGGGQRRKGQSSSQAPNFEGQD